MSMVHHGQQIPMIPEHYYERFLSVNHYFDPEVKKAEFKIAVRRHTFNSFISLINGDHPLERQWRSSISKENLSHLKIIFALDFLSEFTEEYNVPLKGGNNLKQLFNSYINSICKLRDYRHQHSEESIGLLKEFMDEPDFIRFKASLIQSSYSPFPKEQINLLEKIIQEIENNLVRPVYSEKEISMLKDSLETFKNILASFETVKADFHKIWADSLRIIPGLEYDQWLEEKWVKDKTPKISQSLKKDLELGFEKLKKGLPKGSLESKRMSGLEPDKFFEEKYLTKIINEIQEKLNRPGQSREVISRLSSDLHFCKKNLYHIRRKKVKYQEKNERNLYEIKFINGKAYIHKNHPHFSFLTKIPLPAGQSRFNLRSTIFDSKIYDLYRNNPQIARWMAQNLVDENYLPIDTSKISPALTGAPNQEAIFVINDNKIYIGFPLASVFHHSSFFKGEKIDSAGTLKIINGDVRRVSNNSGHYRPTEEDHKKTLFFLAEKAKAISQENKQFEMDIYKNSSSYRLGNQESLEYLSVVLEQKPAQNEIEANAMVSVKKFVKQLKESLKVQPESPSPDSSLESSSPALSSAEPESSSPSHLNQEVESQIDREGKALITNSKGIAFFHSPERVEALKYKSESQKQVDNYEHSIHPMA